MIDYAAIPKTELHLHIEGAAPPDLVRRLAQAKGISTEGLFDAQGGYAWRDFSEFLVAYDVAAAVFTTLDDHRLLAETVLRECAAHGVIHAELAVSSDHTSQGDPVAWGEYLAAVSEGAAAAEAATGITARFISTCIRGLGPERAMASAALAVAGAEGCPRLTGLGMAGDERLFKLAEFAPAFERAREAGLGLTVHSGEFGGAAQVREALDALRPDRLDHGVRAAEDPALVARIVEEGVALSVCPGSNVSLGVYPDWASHPIAALIEAGAKVNVSTDDPPFFGTDMTNEYRMLAETFDWGEAALKAVTLAGIEAAFVTEADKAALRAKLA